MRFSRLFSGELIFRLLLFVVVAGLVIFLAACGESDGKTPSATVAKASVAAAKGVEAKNGAVLRGDGLMIDGTASATILRGLLKSAPEPAAHGRLGGQRQDRACQQGQQ